MATKIGVFVCLLIVAIDIAAGILGIEAGAAQNQLSIFEWKDPKNKAIVAGLVVAAFLLSQAHVMAILLGGFTHLLNASHSLHRQLLSVACYLLTWITFVVGYSMLVIGTKSNNKLSAGGSCGCAHHHIVSIGGTFCFLHALFFVAFYVSATATATEETKHGDGTHF